MIRDNWRLIILVLLLTVSLVAIFVPGASLAGQPVTTDGDTATTNIRFGLDLSGGTKIRAPLEGVTAEGVNVTAENEEEIKTSLAEELSNTSTADIRTRPGLDAVEVFSDTSPDKLDAALEATNISHDTVRQGVTEPTRQTALDVLSSKVNNAGFSGANVYQATAADGSHFIVIEVPEHDRSAVRELIEERGTVRLVAEYPVQRNGTTVQERTTVLTQSDIERVGRANQGGARTGPHVPVALTDSGAQQFASDMQQYGFTSPRGINNCPVEPSNTSHCLVTVLNGERVHSASMSRGLATDIRGGSFNTTQEFVITTTNYSEAQELQVHLHAGALPTSLDLERGTVQFVSPTLAEDFKLYSLVTGILAVLGVVAAVSYRYRNPKVALPMLVTALSEVVILLGFISFIGMPLGLAHIAGLIAAIGTGVDDLIIIADEVMTESVSSRKVFHNRFRKAFWVIMAAAATTLIAMAPLAFLSLGDLRGFAIITILGVIIGVSITRPAYGDILRSIITDK